LGHHAHVVQKFEKYNDGNIYYGLGNFVMPNLREKSYYNSGGDSQRKFVREQFSWNRISLCVTYSTDSGQVEHRRLRYNGHRVKFYGEWREAGNSNLLDINFYEYIYAVFYIISKIRRLAIRFLNDPKIPRTKHLKGVISIIFSDKKK
jgi:hypothetical protein